MTKRKRCLFCLTAVATLWVATDLALAQMPTTAPLQLETKVPLGDVSGRIDHMAIDLSRRRIFVAELGNDTLGVVDLNERKVLHRIAGLKEPQGIGYLASNDTLYVANAGDGSVLLFRGADYAGAGRIDLGRDADNIRVDTAANPHSDDHGRAHLAVCPRNRPPFRRRSRQSRRTRRHLDIQADTVMAQRLEFRRDP